MLGVSPSRSLPDLVKSEEVAFKLNIKAELGNNTVANYTFKIYDDSGEDVSSDFSGGITIFDGMITFGIIAHDVGFYTLKFWITCNELLPDGETPCEFPVIMNVRIK